MLEEPMDTLELPTKQTESLVTHREILQHMIDTSMKSSLGYTNIGQKKIIFDYICQKYGLEPSIIPSEDLETLNQLISTFFAHFVTKYRDPKTGRKITRILSESWATNIFKIPKSILSHASEENLTDDDSNYSDFMEEAHDTKGQNSASNTRNPRGRKKKPFDTKKTRSKLKESSDLRGKYPPSLIDLAHQQNLRFSGEKDAVFVVKRVSSETGKTAKFVKNAILANQNLNFKPLTKKSPEEALFFLLTNNLTREQYTNMKQSCKKSGADIWPSYSYIQDAKSLLKPDGITVEDQVASVPLQEVLDHTLKRTLVSNPEVLQRMETLAEEQNSDLEAKLYYKIGFDASGSHKVSQQTNSEGDHR